MPSNRTITWHDDPAHFRRPSRRSFLYVGLVGSLGLALDDLLRLQAHAESAGAPLKARAQSIIHIFLPGGLAHQESFDPKPYSPLEYRGDMGVVATKLAGVHFNECLKQTAQLADRLAICRSMTHGEAAHERGIHNMFTGYKPSPALQYPSFGSVVAHELGPRNNLPPYICIPSQASTFAGPGYATRFRPVLRCKTCTCRRESMTSALLDADRFSTPSTTTSSPAKRPTASMPWMPFTSALIA
jgi:hypothetical protein